MPFKHSTGNIPAPPVPFPPVPLLVDPELEPPLGDPPAPSLELPLLVDAPSVPVRGFESPGVHEEIQTPTSTRLIKVYAA